MKGSTVSAEPIESDDYPLDAAEIEDLNRLQRLKRERDALEQEITFLTEWAAKRITKNATWTDGDTTFTATIVRGKNTSIDLDALREINPDLADQITKQVIDTTKLKQAQDLGFFGNTRPEASAVVVTDKKPYVKFTAKETASADQ